MRLSCINNLDVYKSKLTATVVSCPYAKVMAYVQSFHCKGVMTSSTYWGFATHLLNEGEKQSNAVLQLSAINLPYLEVRINLIESMGQDACSDSRTATGYDRLMPVYACFTENSPDICYILEPAPKYSSFFEGSIISQVASAFRCHPLGREACLA